MPSKFLTLTKIGSIGVIRFIIRHYYFFLILLVIIPSIIGSIQVARETENFSYPIMVLGLRLTNADHAIYEDVQILKENPQELIGVAKPDIGYWKHVVYYWHLLKVFWRFLGNIFLITLPFMFAYKIFKWQGSKGFESSISHNIISAIITGLIFIFIINLILVVHGLLTGSLIPVLPEDVGFYEQTYLIILTTLPFHGVFSLIYYLISFI